MDYKIKPYIGIGKIKFGMTSNEIKKLLNINPRQFLKSKHDLYKTDSYDDLYFHVAYKTPGICDAVELFGEAQTDFKGKNLLQEKFNVLLDWFKSIDKFLDLDDTGFSSFKFGIGIYAPGYQEDSSILPEGVIIFEKGYYDS